MARVRLADVAALAGVSMKTVSNVVHDYPHVTPEMRRRVQQAIDQLGYRPNLTARRLATGRTGMIALAVPEIDHPYFSELSRRIAEVALENGYRVILEQTLSTSEAEHAVLRDREAGLVDGVIFHPVSMTSLEISRFHRDTPLVLIGEAAVPLTTDHVMIDNVLAAADATRHLIGLGRRRLAFLGAVPGDVTVTTDRRLEGFQLALEETGIRPQSDHVLHAVDFSPEAATAALHRALDAGLGFDGIVCRDDQFAVGALRALHERGVDVPGTIALVGWDDTALARYSFPELSSVSPDKDEIARTAFALLLERIAGHIGPGRHRIASHRIAERASAPAIEGAPAIEVTLQR